MMVHARGAAVVAHVARSAVAVVLPMITRLARPGRSSPSRREAVLRFGGGVVVVLDGGGIDEGLLVAPVDAGVGLLHVLGVALAVVADDGGGLDVVPLPLMMMAGSAASWRRACVS